MKKMLAMLILGASIALPAAAFADEHAGDNPSMTQAPAVYLQIEPANPGLVAGPDQKPIQINDSHVERN